MTLEEQIKGLESVSTRSSLEFRAKNTALATLRKLIVIRNGMAKGDDSSKVTDALIDACGLRTPPPER